MENSIRLIAGELVPSPTALDDLNGPVAGSRIVQNNKRPYKLWPQTYQSLVHLKKRGVVDPRICDALY